MVTADDLEAASSSVLATLLPATGRPWAAPAGTLEWDCWHTAEHMGDCLLSYAAQIAARPASRYVRFLASADPEASPAEVLEFAQAGAGILAATVRTASPASAPTTRPGWPTRKASPPWDAWRPCCTART
jgi:hypothetical protein